MSNETDNQELDKGTDKNKTYTQEEVEKLIQSNSDKRVAQALAKKEKEIAEAKKLLNMSEDEREAYKKSQLEAGLQEKERALALRENKLAAIEVMNTKNIPASLVDLVLADSADEMNKRINLLETEYKKAVADAVKSKLAGTTPRASSVQTEGLTKEQFKKMNINQRQELFRTNPALYAELTKI